MLDIIVGCKAAHLNCPCGEVCLQLKVLHTTYCFCRRISNSCSGFLIANSKAICRGFNSAVLDINVVKSMSKAAVYLWICPANSTGSMNTVMHPFIRSILIPAAPQKKSQEQQTAL